MSDSFKIEDNYKKKKKITKSNKNIPLIICCTILFAVLIILLILFINYQMNKLSITKSDASKPYIYTVFSEENPYEDDTYYEVPTINLVGNDYDRLNQAVMNNYQSVSEKGDYDYYYKCNLSGNTLSLLISYAYYEDNELKRYFESIIIDLHKDKILNKSDILNDFNVDESQINIYLESKFKSIYTDIIKKGYYTSKECDYTCFLNNRKITDNYLDGIAYYIENGSLIGYKYFNFESEYGEEDYFVESDYRFVIKE